MTALIASHEGAWDPHIAALTDASACVFDTVEVTGSIPVSPTRNPRSEPGYEDP